MTNIIVELGDSLITEQGYNKNMTRFNKRNINLEEIKKLYYDDNIGLDEIGRIYGANRMTIRKFLTDNNCSIKNRGNDGSSLITRNPFLPYTENSYYWLGYLGADGCVDSRTNRNKITVCSKDIIHLEKYRNFIHPDIKMIDKINPTGSLIRTVDFSHKETKDFLISIGITPRKSFTLRFELEMNLHTLRGLFDGDGHISKNTGFKITTASLNLVEQLIDFCKTDLGFIRPVISKKSTTTFDVYFRGDLFTLYHYLYSNATIYLERKERIMWEAFVRNDNRTIPLTAGTPPID